MGTVQRLSGLSVAHWNLQMVVETFEILFFAALEVGCEVNDGVLLGLGPEPFAANVSAHGGLEADAEGGQHGEDTEQKREHGHQEHQCPLDEVNSLGVGLVQRH